MYTETDETKPINYYGKTKLEAEKMEDIRRSKELEIAEMEIELAKLRAGLDTD